ncbi:MAG: cell envelope integrity protein TolA [Gammaproteobacteria bacterium]
MRQFIYAVCLHVFVIAILLVSLHHHYPAPIVNKSTKIVHAVAVDSASVEKSIERLDMKKEKKKLVEYKPKPLPKPKLKPKVVNKTPVKKKIEKKKVVVKKPKPVKKIIKKAEHKDENKAAIALQKKIEGLRKKHAHEKSQAIDGVVDKYKGLILEAISKNWLVPPNTDQSLSCQLYINLAPGGIVLDVKVLKSSGDSLLDRSAIAAVYKASPLPAPASGEGFDAFRQFSLTVRPESVV